MEQPYPSESSQQEIVDKLLHNEGVRELQQEHLWLSTTEIKEMQGLFLAQLSTEEGGRRYVFRNTPFWLLIDGHVTDRHFETHSRQETALISSNVSVIRHSFRLKSAADGSSCSAVREIYHLREQETAHPSGIREQETAHPSAMTVVYIKQRYVQSRKKRGDRSIVAATRGSKAALTIVRELIPFHTFTVCTRWTTPRMPSKEWDSFYRAQYALDLWRLETEMREQIYNMALRFIHITAIGVSTAVNSKLSNSMTPDGWIVVPPNTPPTQLRLDAVDASKMQELESIVRMPYVRLVLPYVAWHVRRERYYEIPHWTGGSYAGWCSNGLPHKHGRLIMLLPVGSISYNGEWNNGAFHGSGTLESFDLEMNLSLRFCGEYRESKRVLGLQEWFERGSVCRRFQGTWKDDEPETGVWDPLLDNGNPSEQAHDESE